MNRRKVGQMRAGVIFDSGEPTPKRSKRYRIVYQGVTLQESHSVRFFAIRHAKRLAKHLGAHTQVIDRDLELIYKFAMRTYDYRGHSKVQGAGLLDASPVNNRH